MFGEGRLEAAADSARPTVAAAHGRYLACVLSEAVSPKRLPAATASGQVPTPWAAPDCLWRCRLTPHPLPICLLCCAERRFSVTADHDFTRVDRGA